MELDDTVRRELNVYDLLTNFYAVNVCAKILKMSDDVLITAKDVVDRNEEVITAKSLKVRDFLELNGLEFEIYYETLIDPAEQYEMIIDSDKDHVNEELLGVDEQELLDKARRELKEDLRLSAKILADSAQLSILQDRNELYRADLPTPEDFISRTEKAENFANPDTLVCGLINWQEA